MNIESLVKHRLSRSWETFKEAEKMAEIEHWNACVNRLYYACFYAVSGLLCFNELSSSKHSGVKGLLNLHFIKTEVLPKKCGILYNRLYIHRQQSDYEDFFEMDNEETMILISETKEFLHIIENHICERI